MDSLLHKFSLQNLLRQFFCGVVFFVPLWLVSQNAECECCSCSLAAVTKWETGAFLLFAALASIIGTIIYHLEKNLYSYPLMYIYEKWIFNANTNGASETENAPKLASVYFIWLVWWVVAAFVMMVLLGCRYFVSYPWIALFAVGGIWLLVVTHMLLGKDIVVPVTREIWETEHRAAKQQIETSLEHDDRKIMRYAAVEKISTWADFVHCVQSCSFAWILGSILAYYITGSIFYQGVAVALMLLSAEMIIDMHRYRFIKKLILESGNGVSSLAASKRVDQANMTIGVIREIHSCDEASLAPYSHSSTSHDNIQVTKAGCYEKAKIFIAVVNLILKIGKMIKRK